MESTKKIFVSHSGTDSEIVKLLTEYIRETTNNKLEIWYSSDNSAKGGFDVGDKWYNTIIKKLKESDLVISFLTPNSIDKPWLIFESGYAEAHEKLVPLKFMLSIDEIPSPLQQNQIFNFSNDQDASVFIKKVFSHLEFEESEFTLDDCQLLVKKMRESFKQVESVDVNISNTSQFYDEDVNEIIYKLNNYLSTNVKNLEMAYDFKLNFSINNQNFYEYIRVEYDTNISDVLDSIYRIIRERVKPFSYLNQWVLKEKRTNKRLVIDEFQHQIPAHIIFKKNAIWSVEFIDKPYHTSTETKEKIYIKENLIYL